MKKTFLVFMLTISAMLACTVGFSACGSQSNHNSADTGSTSAEQSTSETPPEIKDGLTFKTLSVDGTKASGTVSNTTTEFSFTDAIVISGNTKFVVALDKNAMQTVITKTVTLEVGLNVVYLFEVLNDEIVNTYEVSIRRRFAFEVTFDTNGGTIVENQTVEENCLATEPQTTRNGYTFSGWDYDFSTPITHNTKITAIWSANTDTKYTVNYYLQNLDNDNFTLHETVECTGTTDTKATAEIKDYAHYSYAPYRSTVSGNIDGDGSRVLDVYYTISNYTLTATPSSAGHITNIGTYQYGKSVTTTATAYIGYTFLGWYNGEELLSPDATYTFTAEQNVTAKFETNAEMSIFDFSSTTETCEITGVKDKTATKIVIPNYVTSIGAGSFSGCSSLTSMVIPDNVTAIGAGAFKGCSSLEEITLPFVGNSRKTANDTPQYPFGYIFGTSSYTGGGETTQEYYRSNTSSTTSTTYYIPTSLQKVTITGGAILCGAFSSCSSLTSVVIPDSVTTIGDYAFKGCSSLTSVVIPDSVTTIGNYAFSGCSRLTSVVIPDSVTTIGNAAFYNCSSLTSVYIGNNVTTIGNSAFYDCDSLTSVEIPDSVTTIGNYAFYSCGSLTSVVIGDSVRAIDKYAFSGCSRLTSITFKDTSTWYRTTSSSCTGGTYTSVTDASNNATYFTSTYDDYYWYKL